MSDEARHPEDVLAEAPLPSGTGCKECDADNGWWFHLRRCVECGHIGCCDDSLGRHATGHYRTTGHRYLRSFEPGENWFWDYRDERPVAGGILPPPEHHPLDQPTPGPAGRVPGDWQRILLAARESRGE